MNLDVVNMLVPAGGQATYALSVPNNPARIGAQSAGFQSEANPLCMTTSNGMRLTLDT